MEKKQKIGAIFQLGGWLAFIMLGYLGIRGYKNSVEKLKTNGCISEIIELSRNIQEYFLSQHNYGELDYKQVEKFNLFPKEMMRPGFREATNSYMGGVDIFYSSTSKESRNTAFEISFQGLSSYGCQALIVLNWDSSASGNLIAVAGYPTPVAAGVLDEIYVDTKSEDIKPRNIFKGSDAPYVGSDRIEAACKCSGDDICSVIWKFR